MKGVLVQLAVREQGGAGSPRFFTGRHFAVEAHRHQSERQAHMHLPARVGAYIRAYRQLAPTCWRPQMGRPALGIMHAPLFHIGRIQDPTTHTMHMALAWPIWVRR